MLQMLKARAWLLLSGYNGHLQMVTMTSNTPKDWNPVSFKRVKGVQPMVTMVCNGFQKLLYYGKKKMKLTLTLKWKRWRLLVIQYLLGMVVFSTIRLSGRPTTPVWLSLCYSGWADVLWPPLRVRCLYMERDYLATVDWKLVWVM